VKQGKVANDANSLVRALPLLESRHVAGLHDSTHPGTRPTTLSSFADTYERNKLVKLTRGEG